MSKTPRRDPTPANIRPSRALVTAADVRRELERLFGSTGDPLVITVHGAEGDDVGAVATYEELMGSLEMTGSGGRMGESFVRAPSEPAITQALMALVSPVAVHELLDRVLTLFGRRLVDPLGNMLDRHPDGLLMIRLQRIRVRILEDVTALGLTHETRQLLADDLHKLLSDEYLAMLAEHEERVQRPKVETLAREVLQIVGEVFRGSLVEWPAEAKALAASTTRSWSAEVELRDIPRLVKDHVLPGLEEFLWTRTGPVLTKRLDQLFASYAEVTSSPPPLSREDYRDIAEICWEIIARRG